MSGEKDILQAVLDPAAQLTVLGEAYRATRPLREAVIAARTFIRNGGLDD